MMKGERTREEKSHKNLDRSERSHFISLTMTSASSGSIQLSLLKSIAITGLVLFFFYTFLLKHPNSDNQSDSVLPFQLKWSADSSNMSISTKVATYPTNISHIGFIILTSVKYWHRRKQYTQAWWRPNVTRGYVFFDEEPTGEYLPWPATSPPYKVNEDIKKLPVYPKLVNPVEVRIFRSILDMYRVGDKDLRWFIMCDDDTLFMVDNLVEVLGKYDHTNYHYIGGNSETVKSNTDFSFNMGFGGAGYALSYPLAKEVARKLDACVERYPYLYVSDHMAQSCLADLGVLLTLEKGIHQIDLHNDISGLLSSHPQTPLLTLHHFDMVDPIFPSMNRSESVNHLMKAAKVDQSRVLQQTICYNRETSWSFSVSLGYSAHIYETIIPRSILQKPLETFHPWDSNGDPPYFMFNTRQLTDNPCEAPHVFFLESVEYNSDNSQLLTTYVRSTPRNLPPCAAAGNHSADPISKIKVTSPAKPRKQAGVIECCDVDNKGQTNVVDIKIRSCLQGEVIA